MTRAIPDPSLVRRQNLLFDHYTTWMSEHPGEDPDDDLDYVSTAREIMGLPPLDVVADNEEPEPSMDPLTRDRVFRMALLDRAAFDPERLHHYWTKGEGLAKWLKSPHPWTTLHRHLVKYVGTERAKRMASEWFHEVFGFWPGSDLNRVTHGKPPRGKRIGPG